MKIRKARPDEIRPILMHHMNTDSPEYWSRELIRSLLGMTLLDRYSPFWMNTTINAMLKDGTMVKKLIEKPGTGIFTNRFKVVLRRTETHVVEDS